MKGHIVSQRLTLEWEEELVLSISDKIFCLRFEPGLKTKLLQVVHSMKKVSPQVKHTMLSDIVCLFYVTPWFCDFGFDNAIYFAAKPTFRCCSQVERWCMTWDLQIRWRAVVLSYCYGLDYNTVAAILGPNEKTIRSWMSKFEKNGTVKDEQRNQSSRWNAEVLNWIKEYCHFHLFFPGIWNHSNTLTTGLIQKRYHVMKFSSTLQLNFIDTCSFQNNSARQLLQNKITISSTSYTAKLITSNVIR